MLGGERRHRGNRAPGGRGVIAGDERLGRRARGGKHVARHVALPARAMQRDQPDQPGDRLRAAGMTGGFGGADARVGGRAPAPRAGSAPTPSRRNSLRARRGPASGRRRGRRCALRDNRRTACLRQVVTADRCQQRLGERVAAGFAIGDGVAPPLQADFARQRFADAIAHRGDFGVEGVERKQRRPACPRGRRAPRDSGRGRRRGPPPSPGLRQLIDRPVPSRPRSGGGDGAVLGKQHVEGPHRRPGRHRIGRNAGASRSASRSGFGIGRNSLPLPTSRISILSASAKMRAKSSDVSASGSFGSQP